MEGSRTEYPAMLDSLDPSHAVNLLNERMKHIGKLNTDIADWLMERRRIEELYVQGLRKLAQKQPPDESSDMGIFTTAWQKITSAATSVADSHQKFALRIEKDVEKPLRSYTGTNREMQSMNAMQSNLQNLSKDYDSAQKKADKLNTKGGKADINKVATASSEFESASSQWSSQAPFVFETLQAIDEGRCNHLRDVLTQFETFGVDCLEKDRRTAENTLNTLLNVETAQEIRTFASRNTSIAGAQSRPATAERRSSRATGTGTQVPTLTEQRSNQAAPASSVGEEKKSRLSGLKRFGTVISKRRQSTQPPVGEKSNSSAAGRSATNLAPSIRSNGGDRPPLQRDQSSSTLGDVQPPPGPPPSASRSHGIESITSSGFGASRSSQLGPLDEQVPTTSYGARTSSVPQFNSLQPPLAPTLYGQSSAQPLARDSEGFAIPAPPSFDPITQAELEGSSGNVDNSFASSQSKVQLRDAPIAEDQAQADSAMANLANRLREEAATPRRTTAQRGRRDVRNTVFMPQGAMIASPMEEPRSEILGSSSPPAAGSAAASPSGFSSAAFVSSLQSGSTPLQSSASPFSASIGSLASRPSLNETADSDTQSLRSTKSASTAAGQVKHAELQGPGLGASIVESVSAWLEQGSVTRAVVIGEMALAHNAESGSPTNDTIRLDNFSALEKVAPNPSFIKQISADRPGEYSIDLGSIARTTVAFKYQVHLDATTFATQAPLILSTTWKVEPSQASVILSYSSNVSISTPITLSNVTIAINIDGRATACLSKPTGTFSKERGLIYWRIDSLTVTPGAAPQKLLARFSTLEEAKPGRVEAKWEMASTEGMIGIGSGLGVSRLEGAGSDPFADQEESTARWTSVGCVRKMVSGTYVAS